MGGTRNLHRHPFGSRLHSWHVRGLCPGASRAKGCRVKPEFPAAGRELPFQNARTILLLDDDTTTLLVLHAILERTRARVIECSGEPCALRACQDSPQNIDLLVADVVLDDSNGPAVARKVKPFQPFMRLLYISGFSLPELQRRGLLSRTDMVAGSIDFLQKPFSAEQFLDRVGNLLADGKHLHA